MAHGLGRLLDFELGADGPWQQHHHGGDKQRRHDQEAGPGVTNGALMEDCDAGTGGHDDGKTRQHDERRRAADRQWLSEQNRTDRRHECRHQRQNFDESNGIGGDRPTRDSRRRISC